MIARRNLIAAAATLAFALSHAPGASAAGPAQDEIDHLLKFVAASSCRFVRNGTEYPADKAREFLARKYQFVASRIATAEDFIKHLATKSSTSGEPYRVRCGRTDALSAAWLSDELKHYRQKSHVQASR